MKALFVPVLLAAVGCLGSQCALAAEPADAKLSLERSEDIEKALKAYGFFDEVRVFTWRGGVLEGKVYFHEGQASKPVDIGAVVLDTAKKLVRDREAFDPQSFNGVIVIAIKKSTGDAAKGRQCHVSIVVRREVVTRDDGKGNKSTTVLREEAEIKGLFPHAGKIQSFGAGGAGAAFDKGGTFGYGEDCKIDGKEFKFYELKLSSKKK